PGPATVDPSRRWAHRRRSRLPGPQEGRATSGQRPALPAAPSGPRLPARALLLAPLARLARPASAGRGPAVARDRRAPLQGRLRHGDDRPLPSCLRAEGRRPDLRRARGLDRALQLRGAREWPAFAEALARLGDRLRTGSSARTGGCPRGRV